jgi:hypothetical protein
LPANADDVRRQHQEQVIIKPDQVDPECRVACLQFQHGRNTRYAVQLATNQLSYVAPTILDVTKAMYDSHTLPLLKHQSHLNNFRPKVIKVLRRTHHREE